MFNHFQRIIPPRMSIPEAGLLPWARPQRFHLKLLLAVVDCWLFCFVSQPACYPTYACFRIPSHSDPASLRSYTWEGHPMMRDF